MQNVGVIHGKRVRRKKDSSRWIWIAVLVLILGAISIATVFLVSGSITTTSQVPGTEGSEAGGISGPTTAEYPYLAEIPAELEGKVQLIYSYSIDASVSNFEFEMELKNLDDRTIKGYFIELVLKDTTGNIVAMAAAAGSNEFIKSGKSLHVGLFGTISRTAVEPSSPPETWILEPQIISITF